MDVVEDCQLLPLAETSPRNNASPSPCSGLSCWVSRGGGFPAGPEPPAGKPKMAQRRTVRRRTVRTSWVVKARSLNMIW